MKKFPDECIDLTVTSPPYDDLRKYNGYNFDYKATLEQLHRVTKVGGWLFGLLTTLQEMVMNREAHFAKLFAGKTVASTC